MVMAYLPRQRIVFQGDLFFMPYKDAPVGPPQLSTISFAQKLKEIGIAAIDRIANVRGRTATGEFMRALEERSNCSLRAKEDETM